MKKHVITIGSADVTLAHIYQCYADTVRLELAESVLQKAGETRKLLESLEQQGASIYGVTTGFGAQGDVVIPPEYRRALQEAVIEYHGVGVGPVLSVGEARSVLFCRIISLAQGKSGVRPQLLEHMVQIYNSGIAPVIPSRGSVGASGDLTPLSYVAAMLAGTREVWFENQRQPTVQVFSRCGITPWQWDIKEGLALVNGTAVMTAIAGIAAVEVEQLAQWSDEITAMAGQAVSMPAEPFADWVQQCKHHPGSIESARAIRETAQLSLRSISTSPVNGNNIQPRYSLRCAPQVNGVLRDTLHAVSPWLTRELNSANDNPLFDAEERRVYHTGNFYGGHVSAAADFLRTSLYTTCNLIDRQIQLLLEGSHLPANLAPESGRPDFALKALGITSSALAAELQQLSAPVSVLSRPTESQNQDVVSMGTVSALKLREAVDTAYLIAAHGIVVAAQALELGGSEPPRWVRDVVPFVHSNLAIGAAVEELSLYLRNYSH